MCSCLGSRRSKYLPDAPAKPAEAPEEPGFRNMPEPILAEITNYVRQRGVINLYMTTADVRAELTRNVHENIQQVDQYPRARQFLHDEEYLAVLKDLLNLSNILDDMEQTGSVPYPNRTQYYNLYSKLYRLLVAKAK